MSDQEELSRLRAVVRDIGASLSDPDDRESLLLALFSEYGMDRAQEIMRELDGE